MYSHVTPSYTTLSGGGGGEGEKKEGGREGGRDEGKKREVSRGRIGTKRERGT